MFLIALVVFFTTLAVVRKFIQNRKYEDVEKIPGPKCVPFFGNALEFGSNTTETFKNQLRLLKEYGPFVRIWIGSNLTLMVAEPDKMQYFLNSTVHINKSSNYKFFKSWLGNGLISSGGNYWKRQRKILTPTFHYKIVEEFAAFMQSNFETLYKKLSDRVDRGTFNIHPLIKLYSLDVIGESAMRTKINAQTNPDTEYIKSFKGFLDIFLLRFFSFFQQNDYLFKLYPSYWKQERYANYLNTFTKNIIKSRRLELSEESVAQSSERDEFGVKQKRALIDLLLNIQRDENSLTDREIVDQIATFLFAGQDSVTSAISFCLYKLSKRTDIQEKLVEESNQIIGDDANANIDFNHVQQMEYLERVVKESMRMHTPVPFVERELKENIVIDGLRIPKGTTIHLHFQSMHNNPDYFANPEKFDPDRFLQDGRHQFSYVPFSAGPRNCIGQRYATLYVKSTVIRILRKFEILESDEAHTPILANNAVLESINGLPVKLTRRVKKTS